MRAFLRSLRPTSGVAIGFLAFAVVLALLVTVYATTPGTDGYGEWGALWFSGFFVVVAGVVEGVTRERR